MGYKSFANLVFVKREYLQAERAATVREVSAAAARKLDRISRPAAGASSRSTSTVPASASTSSSKPGERAAMQMLKNPAKLFRHS